MTIDEQMERIYRRVTLVRGAGDPRHGRLCIMSFVALIAGERHSDQPRTASAMLRRFAIILNDEIPDSRRQTLKPFAVRIIGTHDDQDVARAELLRTAWQTEILPKLRADFGTAFRLPGRSMVKLLSGSAPLYGIEAPSEVASLVARLIAHYATQTDPRADRDWYWLKAIDLLDRMCDVGSDRRQLVIELQHLRGAEEILENVGVAAPQPWALAAIRHLRSLLPALASGT